jgi:hypothetical protein
MSILRSTRNYIIYVNEFCIAVTGDFQFCGHAESSNICCLSRGKAGTLVMIVSCMANFFTVAFVSSLLSATLQWRTGWVEKNSTYS